jgi:tubulin polyglutamylase TTLL6/13
VYVYLEKSVQGFKREVLQQQMEDIIVKTIIAAQPSLQHSYRSEQPDDLENSICFQVLGFDIMLDHKLKPWLIEVNNSPSFGSDTPLDKKVKQDLMFDTFNLLNLSGKRKKKLKKQK